MAIGITHRDESTTTARAWRGVPRTHMKVLFLANLPVLSLALFNARITSSISIGPEA